MPAASAWRPAQRDIKRWNRRRVNDEPIARLTHERTQVRERLGGLSTASPISAAIGAQTEGPRRCYRFDRSPQRATPPGVQRPDMAHSGAPR